MSKEFRRNHEVPRCLLNRWHFKGPERSGVWVFVIAKQKVDLSETRGKKAYSFAIAEDLCVPSIDGHRVTTAEQWFSRSEGVFDKLLRRIERDDRSPITVDELRHFIRALLSLHYRSGYEISQVEAVLRWRPDICARLGISVATSDEARRRAVENCVNAIEIQLRSLGRHPVLEVVVGLSHDLLICDRPILEIDANEFWMPLGPRCMVMIRKGSLGKEGFFVNSDPPPGDGFIRMANDFTIRRARRWVVGASRSQLESIVADLSTTGVKEREDEDKLGFIPRLDPHWWSLTAR